MSNADSAVLPEWHKKLSRTYVGDVDPSVGIPLSNEQGKYISSWWRMLQRSLPATWPLRSLELPVILYPEAFLIGGCMLEKSKYI
jgi:hypothetical protein